MYGTHKMTKTKIYRVYTAINYRCNTITCNDYKSYWWIGIKNIWKSFSEFYNDMWETYIEWLVIDRIDKKWNYCKENCRRATRWESNKIRKSKLWIKCDINTIEWKRFYSREYYKLAWKEKQKIYAKKNYQKKKEKLEKYRKERSSNKVFSWSRINI